LERRHEDGARRSGRVHHCAQVIHPCLECRHVAHTVGEPRAAAIETDHAAGRGEPRKERDVAWILPFDLEIADVSVDENNIDRPLPVDRVCDRDIAALRIADGWGLHAASFEHGTNSRRSGSARTAWFAHAKFRPLALVSPLSSASGY